MFNNLFIFSLCFKIKWIINKLITKQHNFQRKHFVSFVNSIHVWWSACKTHFVKMQDKSVDTHITNRRNIVPKSSLKMDGLTYASIWSIHEEMQHARKLFDLRLVDTYIILSTYILFNINAYMQHVHINNMHTVDVCKNCWHV